MKTLSFNILKPLALTALLIVFAASFNTAEASFGCTDGPHCKQMGDRCDSNNDCPVNGTCCMGNWYHECVPDWQC